MQICESTNQVLQQLLADPHLSPYVDSSYPIPKPFHGSGQIKLIFLGQDPTVQRRESRANVKTVLNLDKKNSLRRYLEDVCTRLGLTLDEHVYATNFYKNFFIEPPTGIKEINIFETFSPYWLPLLRGEFAQFPGCPIIALGEPILGSLVQGDASRKVRDYWGFTPDWKASETDPFSYLKPSDNVLDRNVFPYPHQPSLRKVFYRERLPSYTSYMRE